MRFMALLIVPFLIIGCYSGCAKWENPSWEKPSWEDSSSAPPFDVLKNSNCFRIGGVGIGGLTPPEHIALVKLMDMTDSSQQLENLFYKGSLTGRLYALLGLYYIDQSKYEKLSPRLKNVSYEVVFQAGCLFGSKKVSEIVEEIENGNFDVFLKPTPENI